MRTAVIADLLVGHPGYNVIQQIPGIGLVLAAAIIAEIATLPGSTALASARAGPAWQKGHQTDLGENPPCDDRPESAKPCQAVSPMSRRGWTSGRGSSSAAHPAP
jgi:hypothetical protein